MDGGEVFHREPYLGTQGVVHPALTGLAEDLLGGECEVAGEALLDLLVSGEGDELLGLDADGEKLLLDGRADLIGHDREVEPHIRIFFAGEVFARRAVQQVLGPFLKFMVPCAGDGGQIPGGENRGGGAGPAGEELGDVRQINHQSVVHQQGVVARIDVAC